MAGHYSSSLSFWLFPSNSHYYIANVSTDKESLNASVVAGKRIWEDKACINCHTILGEGAYYAPEVGNVMTRWGVLEDPEEAYIALKTWMESMPTGIEGRRQMPRFELSDQEYRDLANFLIWTDNINAQDWPPNEAG